MNGVYFIEIYKEPLELKNGNSYIPHLIMKTIRLFNRKKNLYFGLLEKLPKIME